MKLDNAVAVVATDTYWRAKRALVPAATRMGCRRGRQGRQRATLSKMYRAGAVNEPMLTARNDGNVDTGHVGRGEDLRGDLRDALSVAFADGADERDGASAARPARCLGRNAGGGRGARSGGEGIRPQAGAGLCPQRLRRRRFRPPRRQRRGQASHRHRQSGAAAGEACLDARRGHAPGQIPAARGGRLQGRGRRRRHADGMVDARRDLVDLAHRSAGHFPPGKSSRKPSPAWPTTATTCRTCAFEVAGQEHASAGVVLARARREPARLRHRELPRRDGDGERHRSLSDAAQAARGQARLAQGAGYRRREGRLGQAVAERQRPRHRHLHRCRQPLRAGRRGHRQAERRGEGRSRHRRARYRATWSIRRPSPSRPKAA